MADNHFAETVEALFKGMDQFVTTKTVVGEAVKVDDAIILPLVDVTCGMAAGSFADNAKQNGGGGMSAKMSPSSRDPERSDEAREHQTAGRCDEDSRHGTGFCE